MPGYHHVCTARARATGGLQVKTHVPAGVVDGLQTVVTGGGERGGCGSDLRRRDASGVRVRLFRRRDWGEMTGVYHTKIMAAHVLAAAFLTRTVHAGRCGGGGGGSAAAGRDCVPLWTPRDQT